MALVLASKVELYHQSYRILSAFPTLCSCRGAHTVWEPMKRYKVLENDKRTILQKFKDGVALIRKDWPWFKQDMKSMIDCDRYMPQVYTQHGDYEYLFKFDNPDTVNSWLVSTDRDNESGYSRAEFTLNKNNKGLFHGYLDTRLPKTGIIKYAGFCNITSPKNMLPFGDSEPYNWSGFTHLVFRYRGDGRSYLLNIKQCEYFDIHWHDTYNFPLFTHGGPYWQTVKVPFSKFVRSHKGTIQDKQDPVTLSNIERFGITLGDIHSGNFSLEIDYIALVADMTHKEQFAYEMYRDNPFVGM